MTKGPHRLVLDRYLDTAQEDTLTLSGRDWKKKARALLVLSDALKVGAAQAELRIGEQTLTGPALRKGMEATSTSMRQKSEQLLAAGEALVTVATQIADTRDARDMMKDLGEKPSPYSPPAGTPGVSPTTKELEAQVADSKIRAGERTDWQVDFDRQESLALKLSTQMDAAFVDAIPPMKAIHGQADPTEPPPDVPTGPGGALLPGTQVPTSGGSGGGGGSGDGDKPGIWTQHQPRDPEPKDPDPRDPDPKDPDPKPEDPKPKPQPDPDPRPEPGTDRTPTPTPTPTTTTTTTSVIGSSQSGVTYTPGGASVSAPAAASSGAMSSGATMGAAGMAGAAGAASASGVRGASAPAAPGRSASAPARAIGSTARSGSAGALSRSATPGSATPGSATRGSASARPTTAGNASSSRAGSPGSAAGRGGSAGRGGAAGARGSGSAGSRSGGSRSAGGPAGAAAGGRGGRKGDRDRATDRDHLLYDQDWLGDDEVAPGVLD